MKPIVIDNSIVLAWCLADEEHPVAERAMVDRRVVDAYERLEQKLLKLGVVVKPRYSLEPPLGTNETRAHNRYGGN